MKFLLTPELEEMIERKVSSGQYQSATEVIQEGLRLLERQDRLCENQLAEARLEIQVGLDQLNRGEGIPGSEVLAALKEKSLAFRKAQNGV